MAGHTLKPGQVFRLQVNFFKPPKPKFLVLACILSDNRTRMFVINSEPTEYQRQNAELTTHQLKLDATLYQNFLRHDSVLCCSEVLGGWTADQLEDYLLNSPECLVGELRSEEITAVRHIVERSRVLSELDKGLILTQFR